MGQNLIELKVVDSVTWKDGDVLWCDSPGVLWYSETTLRLSTEGYADQRYWSEDIISYTPPQFQMANVTGGYCRMDFGDIELKLSIFAGSKDSGNAIFTNGDIVWLDGDTGWVDDALVSGDTNLWPPPREITLEHKYTETDESGITILFKGTGHLASFDRESVRYDLYGSKYTENLLDEIEDYDGNTVTLPRALGAVYYVIPVRIVDVGIYPTYHKAYLSGTTPGIDYNIYDDGVDINSNVTDNGDGTFSLSASPVGEVSMSGTGTITTLSELIDYAKTPLGLSYNYSGTLEASPSPTISYYADSQSVLIDFVSSVAAYFEHLFYISGYTLHAVSMDNANGSRTLTEYDFFPVTYNYPVPIKSIKSEWQTREAGEWVDGGKYVKSKVEEAQVSSEYPYGTEENISPYQYVQSDILTRLGSLLTAKHKAQISLSVPISDDLPVPGEQIIFTDASSFQQDLDITMFCRNLKYDFGEDVVVISGDGVLS